MDVYRRAGVFLGNYYGAGSGWVWYAYVRCFGNETSIAECGPPLILPNYCSHHFDVSIACDDGNG